MCPRTSPGLVMQGRTSHTWIIARDLIAGAIVGGVLGLLVSLWLLRAFRRYFARTTDQPTPGVFDAGGGGGGQFGGLGGPGKSINGLGTQEAGFANGTGPQAHGVHTQGGWNHDAATAIQTPPGAPPSHGAPQHGCFMAHLETQAHTKPYPTQDS